MPVAQIISILLSIKWKQNMTDERGNCLISRGKLSGRKLLVVGEFQAEGMRLLPEGLGHPIKPRVAPGPITRSQPPPPPPPPG